MSPGEKELMQIQPLPAQAIEQGIGSALADSNYSSHYRTLIASSTSGNLSLDVKLICEVSAAVQWPPYDTFVVWTAKRRPVTAIVPRTVLPNTSTT